MSGGFFNSMQNGFPQKKFRKHFSIQYPIMYKQMTDGLTAPLLASEMQCFADQVRALQPLHNQFNPISKMQDGKTSTSNLFSFIFVQLVGLVLLSTDEGKKVGGNYFQIKSRTLPFHPRLVVTITIHTSPPLLAAL